MGDDVHQMCHTLLGVGELVELPQVIQHIVAGLQYILQHNQHIEINCLHMLHNRQHMQTGLQHILQHSQHIVASLQHSLHNSSRL